MPECLETVATEKGRALKRVEDPDGHQVCQVDSKSRVVEIQNRDYMTKIAFLEDGGCNIQHHRVPKLGTRRVVNL